jgi:hypothetical protein
MTLYTHAHTHVAVVILLCYIRNARSSVKLGPQVRDRLAAESASAFYLRRTCYRLLAGTTSAA